MKIRKIIVCVLSIVFMMSCKNEKREEPLTQIKKEVTAKDITDLK